MSTPFPIRPRLLLGPGPSPVHDRILQAMARPTVGHLDPQFLQVMDDVNARLRQVFSTVNPLTFPVSGTGSAGQEAALANLLEPGDTAIIGINGVFGGRLAEMARRMGAEVVAVEETWGHIIDPAKLVRAHRDHPHARLVAVVHAETSTGVRQPLDELGSYLAGTETLYVVDAVTSLGGIPVEVDAHHIDVCYSGTQKCLGVPPGLSPMTLSPRALERVRSRKRACQSWYLDASLLADYVGESSERKYHHTAPNSRPPPSPEAWRRRRCVRRCWSGTTSRSAAAWVPRRARSGASGSWVPAPPTTASIACWRRWTTCWTKGVAG
jgi:alanine-glyoxylate transaminase/serine-glyoxylate transaminase/serine-pyruvate transaminase